MHRNPIHLPEKGSSRRSLRHDRSLVVERCIPARLEGCRHKWTPQVTKETSALTENVSNRRSVSREPDASDHGMSMS